MTTRQDSQRSDTTVRPMAIKDILSFLALDPTTPPSEKSAKAAHEMLERMFQAYYPHVPTKQTVEWIIAYAKQNPLPRSKDQNSLLFILDVAPRMQIQNLAGFYTRVLREIPDLHPRSLAAQRVRNIKDFTPKSRIACWQALRNCLQEWEGKSPESIFSSAARIGFPSALIVGEACAHPWISERVRKGSLETAANAVNAILYWIRFHAKETVTEAHQNLSASLCQDCMYRLLREIDLTDSPKDQRILLRIRLILATSYLISRSDLRFFSGILAHAFGNLSVSEHCTILQSANRILFRFDQCPNDLFPAKAFQAKEFHEAFHRKLPLFPPK